MSSTNTKEKICTAALLMVGGNELSSFSDATREAQVAGEHYYIVLENLLTSHPWHFSKGMAQLARLEATPLFDYQYAFQLPSDMLQFSKIELPSPYEIYENKLYTNLSEVNCVYQFRPKENRFPAYFVQLLVYELAAVFAVALAEDEGKMVRFKQLAADQMRMARNRDSQAQPSRGIRESNYALINVRRNGGYMGRTC